MKSFFYDRKRFALLILLNSLVAGVIVENFFPDKNTRLNALDRGSIALTPKTPAETYTVLAYNDLGMHCMNPDFSEMCILPPFNTLRAQVIKRDSSPDIVTGDVTVRYSIPGNTTSSNKTDFWEFAPDLFGVVLPDDIGLTGNGLTGSMERPDGVRHWEASGIPITPLDDDFNINPFQLATVEVTDQNGNLLAETQAVVPVSWEISCNYCHDTPGISTATDILQKHDRRHGTKLMTQKPVLCASCHADPALGTTGVAGVSSFSHAMHGSHAARMTARQVVATTRRFNARLFRFPPEVAAEMRAIRAQVETAALQTITTNACYTCHPGTNTECQRDLHLTKGITCVNCHGGMTAVADESRTPWVSEPTCASCHDKLNPAFDYEEPGKLFKDSRGHGNIECATCHGSPHAMGPAVTDPDNVQAILHQGQAGPISKCTVCHTRQPEHDFFHSRHED
ncbi:MAG: cytochrome c3 family protein [Pirellulaceae bacterium]